MNVDYVYVSITSTGANTFTCTVADSGATSGTAGAYIPAVKVSSVTQTSGQIDAVTFAAPSAGNIQINKVNQYSSAQVDPWVWTVPASLSNGAGGFTTKKNINPIAVQLIIVDGTAFSSTDTAVVTYNLSTNINQITMTGNGLAGNNLICSAAF